MKAILSITAFLVLISLNTSGQVYSIRDAVEFFHSNKLLHGEWKPQLSEEDIAGSPYLAAEFVIGSVYTTSNIHYQGLPLRYNIYNDQIEFKAEQGEVQAIAAPETITKIEFGGDKWIYAPFANAKKIKKGYFIVLEEGNVSLYKRPQIKFEPAQKAAPYKDAEPAKFEHRPDLFYIRVGNEVAKPVSSKKNLVEISPEHQKEVEQFVKRKKIKPNKPEQLAELVRFCNSL